MSNNTMESNETNKERVGKVVAILDLVSAVDDMRTLQKSFFKTRSPKTLADARQAEAHVDRMLADLLKPTDSQTKLF